MRQYQGIAIRGCRAVQKPVHTRFASNVMERLDLGIAHRAILSEPANRYVPLSFRFSQAVSLKLRPCCFCIAG